MLESKTKHQIALIAGAGDAGDPPETIEPDTALAAGRKEKVGQ
jgi:hypothetical protein